MDIYMDICIYVYMCVHLYTYIYIYIYIYMFSAQVKEGLGMLGGYGSDSE